MIYFLFTMLFKVVASSFWKKAADFYEQSSRRVSSAIGAYWNPWVLLLVVQAVLVAVVTMVEVVTADVIVDCGSWSKSCWSVRLVLEQLFFIVRMTLNEISFPSFQGLWKLTHKYHWQIPFVKRLWNCICPIKFLQPFMNWKSSTCQLNEVEVVNFFLLFNHFTLKIKDVLYGFRALPYHQ